MTDLGQASDATLVVAIGRWHEPSLAETYRRHGGPVHGLCRRLLGRDATAEEVTQEVFVDLWLHPEKFDAQRGTLRAFLEARAHGRSVDVSRSEEARRRREERTSREAATAGYDLERHVWDLAIAEQVKASVAELPDDMRKAIELAYFGGHTYREVAAMLDAPEGTVKSRIRTGLTRLRESLASRGLEQAAVQR
ncbi:MAG: sigma-70 family RNA polymerase sigma factor [Acidimicrobiales bacterium]